MFYYIYMYRYNHDYVMDFYFTVMLRSTTDPYGRPVIEVAYGEILLSLHRGCVRDDSSERVVGMSTWCRPCWTYPGQHQCGLNVYYFLGFHTIKTYILFSKAICSIKKKHWWSLTLSWPDEVQRMFSTAHEFSKENLNHRQFYDILYKLCNYSFIFFI